MGECQGDGCFYGWLDKNVDHSRSWKMDHVAWEVIVNFIEWSKNQANGEAEERTSVVDPETSRREQTESEMSPPDIEITEADVARVMDDNPMVKWCKL